MEKPTVDSFQCGFNNLLSGCVRTACSQLVACRQAVNGLLTTCYKVVESTGFFQVVPTTCYRPANSTTC